jgi:AmiR/NasT family two-component response regulator
LMKSKGLSEAEAFSLIQKKSMDLRKPMGEIAQAVILSEELSKRRNA